MTNRYTYPPSRTITVRFDPLIRYLSDDSLDSVSLPSACVSSASSTSSLTSCSSIRDFHMRQYPGLYYDLSGDSSFNSSPATSSLPSLSSSTSSLESELNNISLLHQDWPNSRISLDHSTQGNRVTEDYGLRSACHRASVSGYGRGLLALDLSGMEESSAGRSVVASPHYATSFQVPEPSYRTNMNDAYNSYNDLDFDETTESERVANVKNVAVAIPALPNASPLACRAPVNPPPPVKTIIKVLMSSKSSINTHNTHGGLESMLQDIKTGRSKVPINMNSTVGTETFGNDKQFRDLIKNGPDASGSRRTSKRKTRIPKVVSPIPMKRFVLRSSTPISSPTRSKSTEGLLNNRTSTEKRRRESTDAQFSPKSPKNIYRRSGKARKSKKRINRPGRLNIEDIYRCYPLIGSHDSRVSAHRIVSGTDTYDNMGHRLSRFRPERQRAITSNAFEEAKVVFRDGIKTRNHFEGEVRQPIGTSNRRHQSQPRKRHEYREPTMEVYQGAYNETPRRGREPTSAQIRLHIKNIDEEFVRQSGHKMTRPRFSFERHVSFPDPVTNFTPFATASSARAEKPRILSTPGEVFSESNSYMPSLDITDIPPPVGQLQSPTSPEYVNISTYRYLALNEDGGTRREMTPKERIVVDAGSKVKVEAPAPPAVLRTAEAPSVPKSIAFNEDSTENQNDEIKKELANSLRRRIKHLKTGKEAEYSDFELAMLTPYHRDRILKVRDAPKENMAVLKFLVRDAVEDRLKKATCSLIHLAYEVLFEVWDDVLASEIEYLLNQQANPKFAEFEEEFFNL